MRREFLEGMVDIAAAGRTVLLSSHQIGEVERVADTVAILRSGQLILVEKLETLKDQIRELNVTLEDNATAAADWRPDIEPATASQPVACAGARRQ